MLQPLANLNMKMPYLIILMALLSGCMGKTLPGAKSNPSKLNTKNLEKNPTTGIYTLKNVNTNDAVNIFSKKIPNGIPLAPQTNIITSENIASPTDLKLILDPREVSKSSPEVKKENVKIDWTKLVIYYLFILHILVIGYMVYKKKLLEKIKNPFPESK